MSLYLAKNNSDAQLIAGTPNNDLQVNHRIGDIIISINNINPQVYYGGKWELFAPGRTIVCIDSNDSNFNEVNKKGGESNHKLTVAEMPSHGHRVTSRGFFQGDNQVLENGSEFSIAQGKSNGAHHYDLQVRSIHNDPANGTMVAALNTGGNIPHNNLQPYVVVYMWVKVE